MSFIKNFISKKLNRHQQKQPSMIVMESDTLGMTVIEETGEDNSCIAQISESEWIDILTKGKLDGVPYNRIYFSFLKGLPNFMRMKIWLMMCTENSSRNYKFTAEVCRKSQQLRQKMEQQQFSPENAESLSESLQKQQSNSQPAEKGLFSIFTLELFHKLTTSKPLTKQSEQIEKDIKRTYSFKKKYIYTAPLMRKILYALSNSGVQYTQGMNYILLYVIIFCLESLGLDQATFGALSVENERNIFIILREIVLRLEEVFDSQNIFKILGELEVKISESVPDVFYNIHKMGMDTYSLFSQNYYSLLTYSDPPDELTKQMLDLFFLESYKAITSLIVRMLEISQEEILKIRDAQAMQKFVKNEMFHYCFKTLCEEKLNAKNIEDFGISFYRHVERC